MRLSRGILTLLVLLYAADGSIFDTLTKAFIKGHSDGETEGAGLGVKECVPFHSLAALRRPVVSDAAIVALLAPTVLLSLLVSDTIALTHSTEPNVTALPQCSTDVRTTTHSGHAVHS